MDSQTVLNVEGMDCANCAMTITRSLEKSGFHQVKVNFATGEVRFEEVGTALTDQAVSTIHDLGYKVTARSDVRTEQPPVTIHHHEDRLKGKLFVSALFTAPLLLHMVLPWHALHLPWVQFVLSTPVMIIGWMHFGRSAWKSIRAGVPTMDVLVTLGSSAAYIYSLAGILFFADADTYLFFETAATIITLIFVGNLIEHRSVRKTTSSIQQLKKLQPETAKRITPSGDTRNTEVVDVSQLIIGDLIQVNEGDRIPADGTVIQGSAWLDESMMTGESEPVSRTSGDAVVSGTLCSGGSLMVKVTALGDETALGKIIELVKNAQHDKPDIQRLGDKVSAIFVPAVVAISILTFLVSLFVVHFSMPEAVMHAIAVLVISCPCAMGLATPTAVMVGIGLAARRGILIKGGSTLEKLAKVKTVVFDKTGTLTTGTFAVKAWHCSDAERSDMQSILLNLERHSSHPMAASLVKALEGSVPSGPELIKIQEDKGIGINGWDKDGNLFSAGSYTMARHLTEDDSHSVYVLRNNALIGMVDLMDEVRPDARQTIDRLKEMGIDVILMTGDRESSCRSVAEELGISTYYFRQMPAEKLTHLKALGEKGNTIMVGDGINDAPALAQATVGVAVQSGTDVAIHAAQVVLLQRTGISNLITTIQAGKQTYLTIKQNLFWAFCYNVIAIPIAAAGFLNPMIGALSMAFSDVMVIGNSWRLNFRKFN